LCNRDHLAIADFVGVLLPFPLRTRSRFAPTARTWIAAAAELAAVDQGEDLELAAGRRRGRTRRRRPGRGTSSSPPVAAAAELAAVDQGEDFTGKDATRTAWCAAIVPAGGAAALVTIGMAAGAAPAVSCREVLGPPVLGEVARTLQISAG
jgi:hypothetical protein